MLNVNYYEVPYRDWNEDGLEAASEYLEVKTPIIMSFLIIS